MCNTVIWINKQTEKENWNAKNRKENIKMIGHQEECLWSGIFIDIEIVYNRILRKIPR